MAKRKWRIVKSIPVCSSTVIEPGTFLGGFPYLSGGEHNEYRCPLCWHQWAGNHITEDKMSCGFMVSLQCPRCLRIVALMDANSDEYKRKRSAEPASEVQRCRKVVSKTFSGGLFDSGPDSTRLGSKDSVGR